MALHRAKEYAQLLSHTRKKLGSPSGLGKAQFGCQALNWRARQTQMNTIVARRDHKINGWTDALKQAESSNPHLNKANLTKKY